MQPARLGAWMSCLVSTALLVALVALPSCAQTVETSQETNDRIRSIAAPARDYVIGGGDVLAIQVFDVPELSREIRVSQTGSIGIPLVRVRLHVSGLTDRKSTRLNSSHDQISYAVFCLKKQKSNQRRLSEKKNEQKVIILTKQTFK